ncbi:MAG TPA: AMP-binding protein, partial [Steroidobacteraceae bacterium]
MAAHSDENKRSPLKAWVRALERTATIERDRSLTLPVLIGRLAERFGEAPALVSTDASLSYRQLAAACHRYARWGLAHGLSRGDTVCLVMANCPDYLAIWLGFARIGATVALINTNLRGELLAHSLKLVGPRYVVAGGSLSAAVRAVRPLLAADVECWVSGSGGADLPRLDEAIAELPGDPLHPQEVPSAPALEDRALYIYTSGTTGLPKAANVSHYRLMQWSHWFAGLIDVQPDDRMYDCLPMYHSVGGVVATGAVLVNGGSVVIRDKFSTSRFWDD